MLFKDEDFFSLVLLHYSHISLCGEHHFYFRIKKNIKMLMG